MMHAEVETLCGAGHGEECPGRFNPAGALLSNRGRIETVTGMNDSPLRVFLTHEPTEDASDLIDALRRLGHVVRTPEALSGWQPFYDASVSAIREADIVLAVPDEPSATVLLDIGVALGTGTPVLLVLAGEQPGVRELADLPQLDRLLAWETIDERLRRAARRRVPPETPTSAPQPALSAETAAEDLAILRSEKLDSRLLEDLVVRVFQQVGAEVFRQPANGRGESVVERPDLVVWHDDLNAGFGLPLPVEILIKTFEPKAILPRLQRTLRLSGARSLLALSARDHMPLASVDEHGRIVLIAPLALLLRYLTELSFGNALGALRAEAMPGGSSQ
jgi:hypothetical protein